MQPVSERNLKRPRPPSGTSRGLLGDGRQPFAEVCNQLRNAIQEDLKRRRISTDTSKSSSTIDTTASGPTRRGSRESASLGSPASRKFPAGSTLDLDAWETAVRPVVVDSPLPRLTPLGTPADNDDEALLPMEMGGSLPLAAGSSLGISTQAGFALFHWNTSPLFHLPQPPHHIPQGILGVPAKLEQIISLAQTNEPVQDPPASGKCGRSADGVASQSRAVGALPLDGDGATNGVVEVSSSRHSSRREPPQLSADPLLLDWIQLKLRRRPTIVVPPSTVCEFVGDRTASSIITFDNAVEFFENGRLVTDPQQLRELSVSRSSSDARSSFLYKLPYKKSPVKFQVASAEAVCRFDQSDWDSVVAVLLNGVDWQFKSWPCNGVDHALTRLRGFYCTLKDSPLPRVATHPACQVLTFPRILRHNDVELKRLFWQLMGEHLMKHMSSLPMWHEL